MRRAEDDDDDFAQEENTGGKFKVKDLSLLLFLLFALKSSCSSSHKLHPLGMVTLQQGGGGVVVVVSEIETLGNVCAT